MSIRLLVIRNGALRQQHHITTLLTFLARQGFETTFVSLQTDSDETRWFASQLPDIKVLNLPESRQSGFKRFMLGGWALRKLMKSIDFDITYVIDSWTLPYIFFATFGKMRLKREPLVYHTFDMLVSGVHSRVAFSLERHLARRSDLNVNTERTRAVIAKTFFNLKKTPLSIPLRLLSDTILPECDDALRASLLGHKGDDNEYLLVYPSYIGPGRLTKELITRFSELPENYTLAVIDGESKYATECHDLATNLGLASRVNFLPTMPYKEVLKLCASADLGCIFHDETTSLGNYFCHPGRLAYYIALGLPVIANAVPVLEAVIYKYSLGICCSLHKKGAFAQAVQEICEDPISLAERKRQIKMHFNQTLHYEKSAEVLAEQITILHTESNSRPGPVSSTL